MNKMDPSNEKRIPLTMFQCIVCLLSVLALTSCGSNNSNTKPIESTEFCGGYPDWQTSDYILPYQVGTSYEVIQGNCSPRNSVWSHYDMMKYAYDFGMPIKTPILASRAGTVIFVREQFTDNDHRQEQGNAVVVRHDDNTVALYGHMTHQGVLVELGEYVEQGEVLALSGNSGSSPIPHLHFQVNACPDFDVCETIPMSFNNARPNPGRLLKDSFYEAVE